LYDWFYPVHLFYFALLSDELGWSIVAPESVITVLVAVASHLCFYIITFIRCTFSPPLIRMWQFFVRILSLLQFVGAEKFGVSTDPLPKNKGASIY